MTLFAHSLPPNAGFLPTRASLMLDAVFLAMFLVVPILLWSIRLAKKGKYQLHKKVQIVTAVVLLVAIIAFELDMQIFGWKQYLDPHRAFSTINTYLIIHLCFAIPTLLLWPTVIILGIKRFPHPPEPNEHSKLHKRLGWISAFGMILTSITGWIFYYIAFVSVA